MKICIIGGGINGLFSAYYLHQQGYDITIIDQTDLSDSCSHGNAGMIVPSHIIPLASPGMISKGLRWMLSSTSPFYVRPRLNLSLAKWGYLFYKNSTAAHVEKSIPILRDLSLLSKNLYQDFQKQNYFNFGWHERGLLMAYQTPAMAHEETEGAAIANKAGIEAHILNAEEVQALEPDTKINAIGGVFYPGDAQVNPNLLVAGLRNYLESAGVKFLYNTEVIDFEIKNNAVSGVVLKEKWLTEAENKVCLTQVVVIAVGAWTEILTKKLGISIPLQGGKGYSMLFDGLGNKIKIPTIMLEARATATPMGNNLRCAGTMEIADINTTVNMNRVQGIVNGVNSFYPELKIKLPEKENVWSGLRPCSPDGLPYIGRVKNLKNVTIATGHGMMGLSLGPATGKLVSEIVAHQNTSINLEFLNPERFG